MSTPKTSATPNDTGGETPPVNVKDILLFFVSVLVSLLVIEGALIVKNKLAVSYDTEMWKYSKALKQRAEDPKIGHTHKRNDSAILQKVEIRTNSLGLRGTDEDLSHLETADRKILLLGSSITLGWGVKEDDVLNRVMEKMAAKDGQDWAVLNTGVGNYNTQRYVENYMANLTDLDVDTIVVQYFVNDAEILNDNYGNFFTRNFQLAVMIWKYMQGFKQEFALENIENYYRKVYDGNGFNIVREELVKLEKHCWEHNIRCVIAMTPDIHQTKPYPLYFINERMQGLAAGIGLEWVDLTPALIERDEEELYNPYNDPHPNRLGHEIMAQTLYDALK